MLQKMIDFYKYTKEDSIYLKYFIVTLIISFVYLFVILILENIFDFKLYGIFPILISISFMFIILSGLIHGITYKPPSIKVIGLSARVLSLAYFVFLITILYFIFLLTNKLEMPKSIHYILISESLFIIFLYIFLPNKIIINDKV